MRYRWDTWVSDIWECMQLGYNTRDGGVGIQVSNIEVQVGYMS